MASKSRLHTRGIDLVFELSSSRYPMVVVELMSVNSKVDVPQLGSRSDIDWEIYEASRSRQCTRGVNLVSELSSSRYPMVVMELMSVKTRVNLPRLESRSSLPTDDSFRNHL